MLLGLAVLAGMAVSLLAAQVTLGSVRRGIAVGLVLLPIGIGVLSNRWYYFPEMRRDEALVFKVYDAATDGRARYTAHTSFEDPTTPPGAPPRRSIEARMLAFFS